MFTEQDQPLHDAVIQNNVAAINNAIREGANIHSVNPAGFGVLHHAINCYDDDSQHYRELITELVNRCHVDINQETPLGTPLYFALKQEKYALVDLLLTLGADTNITFCDHDIAYESNANMYEQEWKFYTPITYICARYSEKAAEREQLRPILLSLLENHKFVSEINVDRRIEYCCQHYTGVEIMNSNLLDYAASRLMGGNLAAILLGEDIKETKPGGEEEEEEKEIEIMGPAQKRLIADLCNIRASEDLASGGLHHTSLALRLRALLEMITKLKKDKFEFPNISSDKHTLIAILKKELCVNLDILLRLNIVENIPHPIEEKCFLSLAKSFITQLQHLQEGGEASIGVGWCVDNSSAHAVVLSFMRRGRNIVVRVDNLNPYERSRHDCRIEDGNAPIVTRVKKMRSAILADIPVPKLHEQEKYFADIFRLSKKMYATARDVGIETVYKHSALAVMKSKFKKAELKFLDVQMDSNCYIRSHLPGVYVRLNDHKIVRVISKYQQKRAVSSEQIIDMRNIFQREVDFLLGAQHVPLHGASITADEIELLVQRFRRCMHHAPGYRLKDRLDVLSLGIAIVEKYYQFHQIEDERVQKILDRLNKDINGCPQQSTTLRSVLTGVAMGAFGLVAGYKLCQYLNRPPEPEEELDRGLTDIAKYSIGELARLTLFGGTLGGVGGYFRKQQTAEQYLESLKKQEFYNGSNLEWHRKTKEDAQEETEGEEVGKGVSFGKK